MHQLLAMIGEQFEHGDVVCGAVINVRGRQEKISLWTKNASNEAVQVNNASILDECLKRTASTFHLRRWSC